MGIERIKALEGRYGHQKVAPHIADHPFDLALVVALAGTTEPVIEQVVGLESREGPGAFTASITQDPGHGQLGVVVEDALGNSAQEGEGRHVAVQEGLGGLRRVGLDEAPSLWGRSRTKQWAFCSTPPMLTRASPKSHWGMSWRMGQRDEHLLGPAAMLPHVVLDRGVLAAEPMLVPEPLEDPLGCVALLPGTPEVVYQDPVDDAGEGLFLSLSKG